MVSYIGLNPAQLGVVIPQEPLTGALRFDQAIAFDLLTQVSFQSQGAVARHPIQSGREGPSDSILEEPEELRVIIAEWGITPPDDDNDERGRDEDGSALA